MIINPLLFSQPLPLTHLYADRYRTSRLLKFHHPSSPTPTEFNCLLNCLFLVDLTIRCDESNFSTDALTAYANHHTAPAGPLP